MLQKPRITVWVLDNGYSYVARVSDRFLGGYWHYTYNYEIPFCQRYEEDLSSFLQRHPALYAPAHEALHSSHQGLVDFGGESFKYIDWLYKHVKKSS
jgi:hypothetical protein